jgi:hypothetical protein
MGFGLQFGLITKPAIVVRNFPKKLIETKLKSSNVSNFEGRPQKLSSELFFDYFGRCIANRHSCLVVLWQKNH